MDEELLKWAANARKQAWDELYSNHQLDVTHWGELADKLDRIIDELGVKGYFDEDETASESEG